MKELILIILIGAVAFFVIRNASASNVINDIPTIKGFNDQKNSDVSPNANHVGAIGLPEGKAVGTDNNQTKANIVAGKIFTEDALRKLMNDSLNQHQVTTQTTSGAQTKTIKGLIAFKDKDSELRVTDAFVPIGKEKVIGVRGRFVPKAAVARHSPTYRAVLTTKTGGTREILASESAIKRLQSNLERSSVGA